VIAINEYVKQVWDERVANKDSPRIAIIEGECYYIADEDERGYDRGSMGRQYKILFTKGANKGLCVYTTNLWCNGKVPVSYKDKLEDNAVFWNK
jgi:hypothetical protein